MSLAMLQRPAGQQQDDHDDHFDHNLVAIQEIPRPHTRGWIATIYYNPEVFPVPSLLDRVYDHYARLYPRRDFVLKALSPNDLESWAPIPFGKADALFRQRGFVSEAEVVRAGAGGALRNSVYQQRNEAAADHFLSKLNCFSEYQDVVGAWSWQKYLDDAALVALMGTDGTRYIPLVEVDGVLLPSQNLGYGRTVHFCYAVNRAAVERGRKDEFRLTYALPEEIARQGVFEIQQATSLYGGASSLAVLLWQTQVLAILRKAAWQVDLAKHIYVATDRFEKEKSAARRLIERAGILRSWISVEIRVSYRDGRRFDRNVIVGSVDEIGAAIERDTIRAQQAELDYETSYVIMIDSVQVRVMNQLENDYEAIPGVEEMGFQLGNNALKRDLTLEQIITAALHGATYMPDNLVECAEDLDEPVLTFQPLAMWIGTLKRHRHALLDRHISALIMSVAQDHETLETFETLLSARLNEEAWRLIVDAVPEILAGGESVPVVYEWTSDPGQPRAAERRDDAILIRGPMLDFPVHEVALWNERAEALFREGGLILP